MLHAACCCTAAQLALLMLQVYRSQVHAVTTIWATEGWRGFYRGWAANALKVVPQNAIRFVSYEFLKSLLGVAKAKTDT